MLGGHNKDRNGVHRPSLIVSDSNNDYQMFYYDQTLDDFNYQPVSYTTFWQRYVVNFKHWHGARTCAPIFAYMGEKASIDDDVGHIGFMLKNSRKFGALELYIELKDYQAWVLVADWRIQRKKESVDSELTRGCVSKFYWSVALGSQAGSFIMPRKTRARRSVPSPTLSPSSFDREKFPSEKNQEIFEKLNLKRKIWSECSVVLDELDPAIRANLKRRGWLPLVDISDPPPPATLILEFYSNISIRVYDSNTLVKSWIQGVKYIITPTVVADALGVPLVQHPVYPYDESPVLSDVMSYITGSSI
nr:hypothetical protein CFP56_04789 [Quercus suber]